LPVHIVGAAHLVIACFDIRKQSHARHVASPPSVPALPVRPLASTGNRPSSCAACTRHRNAFFFVVRFLANSPPPALTWRCGK
jgi:hypothetical protein